MIENLRIVVATALFIGCGPSRTPATPNPEPSETSDHTGSVNENPQKLKQIPIDRSLDDLKTTSVKAIGPPLEKPLASPLEYCGSWPAFAASELGLEISEIEPLTCAESNSARTDALVAPRAPFGEFALVTMQADRFDRTILFSKLGNAWSLVGVHEESGQENRGEFDQSVASIFFQDVTGDGVVEMIREGRSTESRMDHDDDEQTYDDVSIWTDICVVKNAEIACLTIETGQSSGASEFSEIAKLSLDGKGRAHVHSLTVVGEPFKTVAGVFELQL